MATKEKILEVLHRLPEDATVEDAIEWLYVLAKVERGIAQVDEGFTMSQTEARLRADQWRE